MPETSIPATRTPFPKQMSTVSELSSSDAAEDFSSEDCAFDTSEGLSIEDSEGARTFDEASPGTTAGEEASLTELSAAV